MLLCLDSKIKPFGGTKNKLNLSCVELRLLATGCEVAVCMCTGTQVVFEYTLILLHAIL